MADNFITIPSADFLFTENVKTIQEFVETFNAEFILDGDQSLDNSVLINSNKTAIINFTSTFVPNDLNDDMLQGQYLDSYGTDVFNDYENILDNQDICEFSPNNCANNSIEYDSSSEAATYTDLDSCHSNDVEINETEIVPGSLAEIFEFTIPATIVKESPKQVGSKRISIKRNKNTAIKTKVGKRSVGRPKIDKAIIEQKVAKAEKTKDKIKIRTEKNNQASKEYRERKEKFKNKLNMDLDAETKKNFRLNEIHERLSQRIETLKSMLFMHSA